MRILKNGLLRKGCDMTNGATKGKVIEVDLHAKTGHHSTIGNDTVLQRTCVDRAYMVPLHVVTTPISCRSLVQTSLGKGLVCISAVLSPVWARTTSP